VIHYERLCRAKDSVVQPARIRLIVHPPVQNVPVIGTFRQSGLISGGFEVQFALMTSYSKSIMPSYAALPDGGTFATVYEFILFRFPRIAEAVWRERIELNKVCFDDGEPIRLDTPYQERRRICYYREVVDERPIPFQEEIVFENDDFLIADKPHFLPVHPAGEYVNETLITRLRSKYGYEELHGAHRIDRSTAGLVLCVKNQARRGLYQQLFRAGAVKKIYLAAGKLPPETDRTHWHIKARMEPRDHFRMQLIPGGPVNSESIIDLIDRRDGVGLFRLQPVTGKKHQLRVHLCEIGSGIIDDPLYSDYSDIDGDDYQRPMQLLAHRLEFTDPVTGKQMEFRSRLSLRLFPGTIVL
jgi:tRNA pseudouridine32 synthase/23S rRNA pseudouridine746 synthase